MIVDPNAPATSSDLIKDSTSQTFMADVVEASKEVPVLVDFWGPGCQPCETLKPVLESLVRSMGGAVKLVKVNAQEAADIAQQLQVQSVPTVFSFKGGRPVDMFQGALPESDLRKFINKQLGDEGSPITQALAHAKDLLDKGEAGNAQAVYIQVLQHDNSNPEACAGVMRTHVVLGDVDGARQIADNLPEELKTNEHIASAIAMIDLAGAADVDTSEVEAKLAADPNDHQARFDLGMALYGAGQSEEGLLQLLEIVKKDRNWNEDGARLQMLKIFEAIGMSDPLVIKMRKKLTTVLF
ncbi:Thioredoxin domain-containing protein EC-YbbN [Candidatus Terasakiella magnetica]|uniref:Thioredoxin domain-containing protein EC-YbbN n=1 Tax=Candidatus Terasakiella magnetica TaxID=1867952 RepID=A0A1C3RIZ5_9PROT|nr:co-chaperone YbbN [Candidatus Terasakiella magnetica]SCA57235.1 Thioredoxin domain-containing protein EC-YbbN [Candidatus Terasakiella magnetica]